MLAAVNLNLMLKTRYWSVARMSTLSFALTGFVQRLNDTLSIRPGGMIPPHE